MSITLNSFSTCKKIIVRWKSRFFGLLLIVCLLSLLVLARGPFSVKASPNTINVYPGPSAIQSAINSANPGDTVLVHNGTYYEHVVINKSISLVGESIAKTVIDGNKTGTVIEIKGAVNGVSIRGFTIGNSSQTSPNINGSGIFISSYGNTLINNRIVNNAIGVYLSSGNNIISSNTISSNQFYGMYLSGSYSNVISNNTITFNVYGYGVAILNSGNNVFSGNSILNNYNGILLLSSTNNTIYHNNFVGNFQHVYVFESGYPNLWDYGKEGNFWSNYTGVDSNSDGIGDTPHTIGEDNIDQYPLMGRFAEFSIFLDTTIYAVSVISNSTISAFKFKIGAETGNRIVNFNAADGNGTVGFCRIRIPSQLMQYPYIVLVGSDEVVPRLISASAENAVSYFAYLHSNKTITIISSQLMQLYLDLLDKYAILNSTFNFLLGNYVVLNGAYSSLSANYTKLQTDFNNLNVSHSNLLGSYAQLQANFSSLSASQQALLNNYAILQIDFLALNGSYHTLLNSYGFLTGNYTALQQGYNGLNQSYTYLLSNYNALVFNYSRLQDNFDDLYNSQQTLLSDLSDQVQNVRSMIYIFIATTATFLAATVYLSKRAHESSTRRNAVSDEE